MEDAKHKYYEEKCKAFPDLRWPPGSDFSTTLEIELFVNSGGSLKPKKKSQVVAKGGYTVAPAAAAASATSAPAAAAASALPASSSSSASFKPIVDIGLQDHPAAFEMPGFSLERRAITMPIRVHCEDTSPLGHVRLESLVAYAERIRSLSLKVFLGLSLADLKSMNLAILANEYVVEIVGKGCDIMETLRIDTTPEFPGKPLFPWVTEAYLESGELYMQGLFGLSLCQIAKNGSYSGASEEEYDRFVRHMRRWSNPQKARFSPTAIRFCNVYDESGKPFVPAGRRTTSYVVRAADCDLYSVLFQARVTSMTESCHDRRDALSMYVNIMYSVRPSDELTVHVLFDEDSALFLFVAGDSVRITAFGHYGTPRRPICREEIKCCSMPGHYKKLLEFCRSGEKPASCKDFDLSRL